MRQEIGQAFAYALIAVVASVISWSSPAGAQTVENSNQNPTPVGIVSANIAVCDPYTPVNCVLVSLTPVVSAALETSHTFKASPGLLYSAYGTSTSGGVAGFFVCVNATSIAAGPIVPVDFVTMGAGPTTVGLNYSGGPAGAYSVGITCAETVAATPFTYTAPAAVLSYHGLVK